MARNERPSGRTIDPSSDEEIRQVGYIPDDRESGRGGFAATKRMIG